jgi:hypothetical protein
MAYRAPFWLWTSTTVSSKDEDKEENANILPVTPEDHILKQVFLAHASEKYKMFAFAPEALLARRMYAVLREGVYSQWALDTAVEVVREWGVLHPEDGVVVEEKESSDEDDESDDGSEDGAEDAPFALLMIIYMFKLTSHFVLLLVTQCLHIQAFISLCSRNRDAIFYDILQCCYNVHIICLPSLLRQDELGVSNSNEI